VPPNIREDVGGAYLLLGGGEGGRDLRRRGGRGLLTIQRGLAPLIPSSRWDGVGVRPKAGRGEHGEHGQRKGRGDGEERVKS